MITGITIEHFKGIREQVKLDFRPITLLFGANSAGKSTILYALHYAREVFERHNLDADQTIAGESTTPLLRTQTELWFGRVPEITNHSKHWLFQLKDFGAGIASGRPTIQELFDKSPISIGQA